MLECLFFLFWVFNGLSNAQLQRGNFTFNVNGYSSFLLPFSTTNNTLTNFSFSTSVDPKTEFLIVRINVTADNFTFTSQYSRIDTFTDDRKIQWITLKPSLMSLVCSADTLCPVNFTLKGNQPAIVKVEGFIGTMLDYDILKYDVLAQDQMKMFGIEATGDNSPILIVTTPNQTNHYADVDLFIYTEYLPTLLDGAQQQKQSSSSPLQSWSALAFLGSFWQTLWRNFENFRDIHVFGTSSVRSDKVDRRNVIQAEGRTTVMSTRHVNSDGIGGDGYDFLFPNSQSPAHVANAPEEYLLLVPPYPGLFILVNYGVPSTNLGNSTISFSISATPNYKGSLLFGLSMFGIVGALTVLILCLFSAAAVIARRRRAVDLRFGGGDFFVPNGRSGGATNEQIANLKRYPFKPHLIPEEDAKCAICLGDYVEDEDLRDLPCGHHFHLPCIDQWLKQKKHCPLCQQNIETAKDVASHRRRSSKSKKKEQETRRGSDNNPIMDSDQAPTSQEPIQLDTPPPV